MCKKLEVVYDELLKELTELKEDTEKFHAKLYELWNTYEKYSNAAKQIIDLVIKIVLLLK